MNPSVSCKRGYSLVELMIVVAILGVIAVTGYRVLIYFTREAMTTTHSVTDPRRVEYNRFTGVLNDRLAQAWSYAAEEGTADGLPGRQLRLYNADGDESAKFGIYTDGVVYQYALEGTNGLSLKYFFTNQAASLDYALTLSTNHAGSDPVASWRIPPPHYYRAATDAFRGLFMSADDTDLERQVSEHRTNRTGLLQHDISEYNFTPRHAGFR